MTPGTQQHYFPQLTGVRAIAAFMVYFFHFNPVARPSLLGNLIGEFHIGVNVFFVLSGFLICYRYDDNVELTPAWFGRYLKNRFARIYPMYFLLTTLTFAELITTRYNVVEGLALYVSNITFLRGFFNDLLFTGIPQGWTLTVEESFYFLAPFIFVLSKRYRLWPIAALLMLLGVGSVLVCRRLDCYGLLDSFSFLFMYTFFGRCLEFFMGVQLARVMKRPGTRTLFSTIGDNPLIRAIGPTYLGILCVISTMQAMTVLHDYRTTLVLLGSVPIPLGIALAFYGLLTERSRLRTILALQPFELAGKASYVFYLIHIGFIHRFISGSVPTYDPLVGLSEFLMLIVLAIVLHMAVEEPFNQWIRSLSFVARRASANSTPIAEQQPAVHASPGLGEFELT